MNVEAEIVVKEGAADIQSLLEAEDTQAGNERSQFTFKKTKDELSIKITAKDPVALRASLNTITRILVVYEKTRGLIK